jgi:hypothetical protein
MQRGDSSLGTKPGIDGDLVLLPVAQATVIRDADVLLQLRDLWVSEQHGELRPARDSLRVRHLP